MAFVISAAAAASLMGKGGSTLGKVLDKVAPLVDKKKILTSSTYAEVRKVTKGFNIEEQKKAIEVLKWKETIFKIAKKMESGATPTEREKNLLEAHEKLFTEGRSQFRYFNVNSGWISQIRYFKNKKELIMKIEGYPPVLTFFNVPFWVYIYLIGLKSSAGTYWWFNGFGLKYSNNPNHWRRGVGYRKKGD